MKQYNEVFIMKRILLMTGATLALALTAPIAASADSYRNGMRDQNSIQPGFSRTIDASTVGSISRDTEEAGYPQPVSDREFGGYTSIERDTSEEGFDK